MGSCIKPDNKLAKPDKGNQSETIQEDHKGETVSNNEKRGLISKATSFYETIRDHMNNISSLTHFSTIDHKFMQEHLERQIQDFTWDVGQGETPFLQRASEMILGLNYTHRYIFELFSSFQVFLKYEVIRYFKQNRLDSDFWVPNRVPGPLDLFWVLAISQERKYQYLCEYLIDKLIFRHDNGLFALEHFKWQNFTSEDWETDKASTIWVNSSQFAEIIDFLRDVFLNKNSSRQISPENIVKKCKKKLRKITIVARRGIPKSPVHKYMKCLDSNHSEIQAKIERELQGFLGTLRDCLTTHLLYSATFVDNLLKEYIRFLVLQYHSRQFLCPSPLVGIVWIMHISFPQYYHEFSQIIYGDYLNFKYCKDHQEVYKETLQFYKCMFEQEPDSAVWSDTTFRSVSIYQLIIMFEQYVKDDHGFLYTQDLVNFVTENYPDFVLEHCIQGSLTNRFPELPDFADENHQSPKTE